MVKCGILKMIHVTCMLMVFVRTSEEVHGQLGAIDKIVSNVIIFYEKEPFSILYTIIVFNKLQIFTAYHVF